MSRMHRFRFACRRSAGLTTAQHTVNTYGGDGGGGFAGDAAGGATDGTYLEYIRAHDGPNGFFGRWRWLTVSLSLSVW